MNHPVCIYLDSETATRAAAAARRGGTPARIKVESLPASSRGAEMNLFIIESDLNDRQKVIDSIADADRYHPRLASEAMRCPICDSIQIEFPEHPSRSPLLRGLGKVMDWIGRHGNLADGARFRCRRCSHLWAPFDKASIRNN